MHLILTFSNNAITMLHLHGYMRYWYTNMRDTRGKVGDHVFLDSKNQKTWPPTFCIPSICCSYACLMERVRWKYIAVQLRLQIHCRNGALYRGVELTSRASCYVTYVICMLLFTYMNVISCYKYVPRERSHRLLSCVVHSRPIIVYLVRIFIF